MHPNLSPQPVVILFLFLISCTPSRQAIQNTAISQKQLQQDLLSLSDNPTQSAREAELLAKTVIHIIEEKRKMNRMIGWPWANNGLVRLGLRPRGLCHQWAEALITALADQHPKYYEIHWMVARKGKMREHNAALVVARGKPVADGLILDPWRVSGRPFWIRMKQDTYPWRDDPETLANTLP